MMYVVRIDTENAAFEGENLRPELARILRQLAESLERDEGPGLKLRDINGNTVGKAYFERKL